MNGYRIRFEKVVDLQKPPVEMEGVILDKVRVYVSGCTTNEDKYLVRCDDKTAHLVHPADILMCAAYAGPDFPGIF